MKKQQREIYQVLADEIDWCLCSFCKYAKFDGSPCYDDAGLDCTHPLGEIWDDQRLVGEPGLDCWGFRPNLPLSDIADIVGLILSQGFDPEKTMYSFDKEGIEVEGIRKGVLTDASSIL